MDASFNALFAPSEERPFGIAVKGVENSLSGDRSLVSEFGKLAARHDLGCNSCFPICHTGLHLIDLAAFSAAAAPVTMLIKSTTAVRLIAEQIQLVIVHHRSGTVDCLQDQ